MLALVIALVPLLNVTPAFANGENGGTGENGDDPILVDDYITKYLQMPCGTTRPDAEFEFTFELVGQINAATGDRIAPPATGSEGRPAIAPVTVTFDEESDYTSENDVCTYVETTAVFLTDAMVNAWANSGHFIFNVRETANTNADDMPFMDGYIEDMDYDSTLFELHVVVSQNAAGDLVISGMYAWNTGETSTGWIGEDGGLIDQEGKVDYISFLNTFRRFTDPYDDCPPGHPDFPTCLPDELPPVCPPADPDYPCLPDLPNDNGVMVAKRVTGDQASHDQYFDFQLVVTRHVLDDPIRPVTGFVWTYNNDTGYWERATAPVSFGATPGPYSFQLRHNQVLVFDPILVGTTVEAVETNAHGYTPSVVWTFANPGAANAATTGNQVITEGLNDAVFTNELTSIPITGLIMNNLPIILISVGTIGFIMMIIVGKKRRAYE